MLMSVHILSPLVVRLFVLDMIYNTHTILLSLRSPTTPIRASDPGRETLNPYASAGRVHAVITVMS